MSMSSLSSLSEGEELAATPRRNPPKFHALEEYDDLAFFQRFRLNKATVVHITGLIENHIKRPTKRNRAIEPIDQVLITLRFLATGSFQRVVGDLFNVQQPTVHRIVHRVVAEIARLKPMFINMPRTDEERQQLAGDFYSIAGFPRVIGALDCSHIKTISPGGDNAEQYRNRKGYFSINAQMVCDANLYIRHVIARWPGSVHDSTIFNDSPLCAEFERRDYGDYLLLGDSGYPCKAYLLTPLNNTNTPAEERYNKAQISTRNPIERLFGVLKRRFPCLQVGLAVAIERAPAIIVACAVLHNIATARNDTLPPDDQLIIEYEQDVPDVPTGIGNFSVRQSIIQTHFN